MARFEHLLKSYDVSDMLDEIASADPPAYLRRCFAEGYSAPHLSWVRVQQLALCAIVLDSIVDDRDYDILEPELVADWRAHYGHDWAHMKDAAAAALRRAFDSARAQDPDAAVELQELEHRLAPARSAPA
jgi:hypothetical protein